MTGFKFGFVKDDDPEIDAHTEQKQMPVPKDETRLFVPYEIGAGLLDATYMAEAIALRHRDQEVIIYKRHLRDVSFSLAESDEMNGEHKNAVISALESHSDLIPGVYEGGLKTWECSFDLVQYLIHVKHEFNNFEGFDVLELGCGSALPGLFCLFHTASKRNEEVIKLVTYPNIAINASVKSSLTHQIVDVDISQDAVNNLKRLGKLWSGDWSSLTEVLLTKDDDFQGFDLVLSSETIYDANNYVSLVQLISKTLKHGGIALFACKSYYFGCSGSAFDFSNYINQWKQHEVKLHCEILWTDDGNESAVRRHIMAVRKQ